MSTAEQAPWWEEPINVDGPLAEPLEADRVLRKLAQLRRRMDENRMLAEAEIARIREWLDAENGKLQGDVDWWEQSLTSWHRRVLEADPTRKTIRLPGGTLKARKQPDEWRVDEDAFLPWAKAHCPEVLRVRVVPDRAVLRRKFDPLWAEAVGEGGALRAICPSDGELVPGVTVVPGEVRFTVDPDTGEGE